MNNHFLLSMFKIGRCLIYSIIVLILVEIISIDYFRTIIVGDSTLFVYQTVMIWVLIFLAWALAALHQVSLLVARSQSQKFKKESILPIWLLFISISIPTYLFILLLFSPNTIGLQNIIVYSGFFMIPMPMILFLRQQSVRRIIDVLQVTTFSIALASVFLIAFSDFQIFTLRAFGLIAVLLISVCVPGSYRFKFIALTPYLIFIAVALSGSRTSTLVVGTVLVAFGLLTKETLLKKSMLVIGNIVFELSTVAIIALLDVHAENQSNLVDRITTTGDSALKVAGVTVNSSGRISAWKEILKGIEPESWILGNGPGSSTEFVRKFMFPWIEPHNDYIRIFFDFGLIGCLLVGLAYTFYGIALYKAVRYKKNTFSLAGVFALLSISVMAVTDNPLIVSFIMFPLAVVISLGIIPTFEDRN